MNIWLYIVKRMLAMIPTLIGISLVAFFLINLAPGGPVEQRLQAMRFAGQATGAAGSVGASASSATQGVVSNEVIEALKRQYGFDKPVHIRYVIWLKRMLTLDFGESFIRHEPVLDVIISKLPVSLMFGLSSFILTYLVCIPLGIFKAIHNKSKFDVLSSGLVFVAYSIPSFVVAIVLVALLGTGGVGWFPIGGVKSELYEMLGPWDRFWDRVHHAILPLFCYMLGSFAVLTMLMKNSMLEEIRKDYVRTARAKGLDEKKVVFKHALRNALLPISVGFGSILTVFFGGSLLLETIFNLDGIGLLSFQSVLQRDINVIMGLLMIQSFVGLLAILLSDIILVFVDPRIDFNKAS